MRLRERQADEEKKTPILILLWVQWRWPLASGGESRKWDMSKAVVPLHFMPHNSGVERLFPGRHRAMVWTESGRRFSSG